MAKPMNEDKLIGLNQELLIEAPSGMEFEFIDNRKVVIHYRVFEGGPMLTQEFVGEVRKYLGAIEGERFLDTICDTISRRLVVAKIFSAM